METVLASVKCLRALRAELMEKQKNERSVYIELKPHSQDTFRHKLITILHLSQVTCFCCV